MTPTENIANNYPKDEFGCKSNAEEDFLQKGSCFKDPEYKNIKIKYLEEREPHKTFVTSASKYPCNIISLNILIECTKS